mmetsp:Transcript_2175/g.4006  ORF Transcript_2175/g.4006 Transcript_2175/m.4006 type:complete len:499 (-) Transcript_2175:339-1835(-)
MAQHVKTWYHHRGNAVIIFCIVWVMCVFYTSAPFLISIDKNYSSSIMNWVGISGGESGNIDGKHNISDDVLESIYASTTTNATMDTTSSITGEEEQEEEEEEKKEAKNSTPDKVAQNDTAILKVQRNDNNDGNDHNTNTFSRGQTSLEKDYYTSPEYMRKRIQLFNTWFQGNDTKKLRPNADENGTILDFAIVGFPKCGTTTVEANLGYLAPMPIKDICTPVHQTVWYAYKNWAHEFKNEEGQGPDEKLWRGTKCPAFIQGEWLISWSEHLPRTKLIVGVRHPVLWFQSFWNMQVANHLTKFAGDDPYTIMKPCPNANGRGCRNGCPNRQLLCMHRGRFHVALASLGKTDMSQEERSLLAANDPDGGENVPNHGIRNPVFIYEQSMLGKEYLWNDMANYLGVDHIRHDKRVNSHGKNRALEIDFCHDKYDAFRAGMMPIAYEVALWLQIYLMPLARNQSRTDVVVANPDEFERLLEKYKEDPCGKLSRLDNGTFTRNV